MSGRSKHRRGININRTTFHRKFHTGNSSSNDMKLAASVAFLIMLLDTRDTTHEDKISARRDIRIHCLFMCHCQTLIAFDRFPWLGKQKASKELSEKADHKWIDKNTIGNISSFSLVWCIRTLLQKTNSNEILARIRNWLQGDSNPADNKFN